MDVSPENKTDDKIINQNTENDLEKKQDTEHEQVAIDMNVIVNGTNITLTGKKSYIFVDIFDKYEFDLKNVGGTKLIQKIDGKEAEHFSQLHQGAVVEIYWMD